MESGTKWGWILLCSALCAALCQVAVAQSLSVGSLAVSPSEIWLNENPNLIKISARCDYGGSLAQNADMWAQVAFPRYGGTSTAVSRGGSYDYSMYASFPEAGTYTVTVYCSYSGQTASASRSFSAHRLELSADYKSEIEAYLGGSMEVLVAFKLDGALITPEKGDFSVFLGLNSRWEELEQLEDPVLAEGGQRLRVKVPLYSSKIKRGLYDLRVEAEHGDETLVIEKMQLVWVNNPLEIYLQDNEVVHAVGSNSSRNISAKVVFKAGSLWDLDAENFRLRFISQGQSKDIPLNGVFCDRASEICLLSVDLPSMSPGEYSLEATVAYPTFSSVRYSSSDVVPLREVLRISGSVRNARGDAVVTTMTVEGVDSGEIQEVRTTSQGNYSLDLLPGRYNFVFRFAGGPIVSIYNVSLSKAELVSMPGDMIRFDMGHLGSDVPDGMRLLQVAVVELALPFSEATVYIPYDGSGVAGDEKKLKVYACDRWNFERRVCSGSWSQIEEVDIQTVKDAVEFNTSSYGAFMVGESEKLVLSSAKLLDDSVFMESPVVVEGKVVDSKEKPVHGAVVSASFPAHGLSSSTTSSIEGEFSLGINAPEIDGDADLVLSVAKDLYVSSNQTFKVSVGKKKEISLLNVPDIVPVSLEAVNDIEFKLINSGQVDIEDPVYVHVAGISSDWYDILPEYVSSLRVGEEKSVVLRVKLNNELCGGKCNKFYLVNLEAKSWNISRTASFTLQLPVSASENESETSETEAAAGSGVGLTGFAVSVPSFSSPYLYLTAIVVLLLLIVNKKKTQGAVSFGKKHKHGQTLRESIMSSFGRIRK